MDLQNGVFELRTLYCLFLNAGGCAGYILEAVGTKVDGREGGDRGEGLANGSSEKFPTGDVDADDLMARP